MNVPVEPPATAGGDVPRRIVVVGGGLAGARVCEELRRHGYDGTLTMLGREPHPPYDRPPLSKEVLRGAADPADVPLSVTLGWDAAALEVDLRLDTPVTALRQGGVRTPAGEFEFDACVIATGAEPVRLPGDGAALTLRTLDDAIELRGVLAVTGEIVLVGASWIGAEVATAAAAVGCLVTCVEAAPTPLPALGGSVGERTRAWWRAAGADLRTSTPVTRVERGKVVLAAGDVLEADLVVEGVGVRPDTGWLAGSGLAVGPDGVHTDQWCRTSMPYVVAVGDVAARWSPRAGRRVPGGHWDDALRSPAVAAATLLSGAAADPGVEPDHAPYDPPPYFWSEQFGHYVQRVGWCPGEPRVWRDGDDGWAAAWLDDQNRLVGLVAVDRPRDLVQARKLIEAGHLVDPTRLADPNVKVSQSLA